MSRRLPNFFVLVSLSFCLSSLAATADDWRTRSIYQESPPSRVPRMLDSPCRSSRTDLHLLTRTTELLLLSHVIQLPVTTVAARGKASLTIWTISNRWALMPFGYHQSSPTLKRRPLTELDIMGENPASLAQ